MIGNILRFSRPLAAASLAGIGIFGLAACAAEPAPAPEAADVDTTEEAEEVPAVNAEGQPAWALPAVTAGEKISTITVGDIVVEVYQVDVVAATKTGQFANPDTNKPIIDIGDDIVFVNYVVSNTGDAIDLGASLVNVSARYDDWPYLQGMDSVVDRDLFTAVGLSYDIFGPDSFVDPSIYTFGTGERYSTAQNFPYQAGSPITFDATVTPVDADGDLDHDKRAEAEATGTIK
ncbi:hypothetical protein [Salinibacterium sp. PAMC 21357]|uniref:hypothetical protein n=1 Tax=Salinibacterium sp. PAMC 21357 TaxID=1112215 RepID=UPI0002E0D383|nr:hypothetical protein [Salinibacterium sp. PAMC 21357]